MHHGIRMESVDRHSLSRVALLLLSMAGSVHAQAPITPPPELRQQGEQQERLQREREEAQRSLLQPAPKAPTPSTPEPIKPWPADESPCLPLREVALVGDANRQLHPNERALAKRLAQKSGGKYTAEEIENALRTAGNNKTGESVVAGMVVDPSLRDAIYDKGAVWTTGADGWLVQVLPPQPDADLSAFIKQNTGETYGWYTPSSGGMPSNSNAPRDRLTGQPLDEKGRYSQTVVLDGKAYEPKYHPCATAECIRTGVNLDMSDPDTQAYVKALDAQVFKGIGRGATLGIVAFSTGVVAATLGGVGLIASAGEAFTGSTLTDQSLNELSQRGGQWFFENVLRYPPAAATRSVAMIALAGGWDSFVARLKTDLFGVEN